MLLTKKNARDFFDAEGIPVEISQPGKKELQIIPISKGLLLFCILTTYIFEWKCNFFSNVFLIHI